jgi:hypothetical protein
MSQWELQLKKCVEQPMLGVLNTLPRGKIGSDAQIGNCSIVPTCSAVVFLLGQVDKPVACRKGFIRTKSVLRVGCTKSRPSLSCRLQGRENCAIGDVAEPMRASQAASIFKIKDLAAILASEQSHSSASENSWMLRLTVKTIGTISDVVGSSPGFTNETGGYHGFRSRSFALAAGHTNPNHHSSGAVLALTFQPFGFEAIYGRAPA